MLPEQLSEMQQIYAMHLRGEKIDIAAVEARIGRPLANEQQTYTLRDGGVAVLPVTGVLAPKANLLMQISGGASTQMLAQQVRSMRADPRVKAGILAVDSPGGSTLGTPALAAEVAAMAAEKPLVTVGEGTMASGAYWVGSAANAVYIEGSTDMVGSIGVYQRLSWDKPAPNTMEMVRGKYKRASVNGAAPSAEIVAYHEGQIDHIYSVFVEAVAGHRGVDTKTVLQNMADGRVFIGQQAINAGLVDGVSTVDAMVERLATNPSQFAARTKVFALGGLASPSASAGAAPSDVPLDTTTVEGGPTMADPITRESLERDHAALFAQVRSEFVDLGATQERDRIADVRAQGAALPGHEKLIEQLAYDGKTTGPEAAAALVAAEGAARRTAAQAHFSDAPAAVPNAAAPVAEGGAAVTESQQSATLAASAVAILNRLRPGSARSAAAA